MNQPGWLPLLAAILAPFSAPACDLCAVYNATDAGGGMVPGFLVTVAGQYVAEDSLRVDGTEIKPPDPDFIDSLYTHLVAGYNPHSRVGVSLNLPLVYRSFKRTDFRYSTAAPPVLETERGTLFDPGDLALIGRLTVFTHRTMAFDVTVNVLAGVKFPTGDDSRLDDEVAQTRIYDSLLPPGTPHDPLSHAVSPVHQHDLAPGSGSFDGIFGVTLNSRWKRAFLTVQSQYYLRTRGKSGFRYGDEFMVSGGPGFFLISQDAYTVSLQALAGFEWEDRDSIDGRTSDRTGMTFTYAGPQLALTWSDRLSVQAGFDFPLHVSNNGYQAVASYRVHGGVNWRF